MPDEMRTLRDALDELGVTHNFSGVMRLLALFIIVFALWLGLSAANDRIDTQSVALSALYARVDSLEAAYREGE